MVRERLLNQPRIAKQISVIFFDLALIELALWFALSMRLGDFYWPSADFPFRQLAILFVVAPILGCYIFLRYGLYNAVFRYSGISAIDSIFRALLLYALIFAAVVILLSKLLNTPFPRSVLIIYPLVLLIFLVLSRVLVRFVLEGARVKTKNIKYLKKVLIYGAGSSGVQLRKAMSESRYFWLIGFVDDNVAIQGKFIEGIKIYTPSQISCLIEKYQITDLILAMPSISRARRLEIIKQFDHLEVKIKSLPSIDDLAAGKISISDVKDLDAEDLLGRTQVAPNIELIKKNIFSKVVFVTGAGGSIGSELCRQIIKNKPKHLIFLELNEYALYKINNEIKNYCSLNSIGEIKLTPLLGSILDEEYLSKIFKTWSIDTVYHAAAYKHVPIVEANVAQGVKNNIFGTHYVVRCSEKFHVSNFVFISTDKAVRPTNIMGASKRFCEMLIQARATQENNKTLFSIVRFGNVLGSSGSVVPLFKAQIEAGGPVTVTHPDITRYFMSISEAASLVIQSGALADNLTANGQVFVLDMGEPVRLNDLAHKMIELSGFSIRSNKQPDGDIEVIYTGLRPGEKLFEELLIGDNPQSTIHPKIMRAQDKSLSMSQMSEQLRELSNLIKINDIHGIYRLFAGVIDGFSAEKKYVDYFSLEDF